MSSELITHLLNSAADKKAKVLLVGNSSLSYDAIMRVPSADEESKFIIKIREDVERVSKDVIMDLIVLSKISNSTPLLIGIRYGEEEMRDGVAYKVHGIYAVGIRTFKRVLDNEGIKFVKDKGMVKARIRSDVLRRLRESRGMSLGDLAKALGVTRKTVYEYERGSIEASERSAQALIELFSEDALDDVNLKPNYEEVNNEISIREETVDYEIKRLLPTFKLYSLLKAHAKIAAYSGKDSYLVESSGRVDNEVISVAKVLGIGLALIERNKHDVEFIEVDKQ
ncbi:MAG: helix-turn-helix domain-containing protein [Vulcanisaeta sp. AZ3]